MAVEMVPVVSSQLQAIGYDREAQKAYVRFRNNALYIYDDVPEVVVQDILNSPSKGQAFASLLKYGYGYRRVE